MNNVKTIEGAAIEFENLLQAVPFKEVFYSIELGGLRAVKLQAENEKYLKVFGNLDGFVEESVGFLTRRVGRVTISVEKEPR